MSLVREARLSVGDAHSKTLQAADFVNDRETKRLLLAAAKLLVRAYERLQREKEA